MCAGDERGASEAYREYTQRPRKVLNRISIKEVLNR